MGLKLLPCIFTTKRMISTTQNFLIIFICYQIITILRWLGKKKLSKVSRIMLWFKQKVFASVWTMSWKLLMLIKICSIGLFVLSLQDRLLAIKRPILRSLNGLNSQKDRQTSHWMHPWLTWQIMGQIWNFSVGQDSTKRMDRCILERINQLRREPNYV